MLFWSFPSESGEADEAEEEQRDELLCVRVCQGLVTVTRHRLLTFLSEPGLLLCHVQMRKTGLREV